MTAARDARRRTMTRKELVVLLLLVVLCAVVAAASPQFLSVANLQNVGRLVGMYGIFSIGVGIVIITGGIDLSVGSICALLGVLLSMMLVEWGWPASLALAAVMALGAGLGAAHGLLVAPPAAAAVHRHALRPAPLSRRRTVHRARFHEGVRNRRGLRVAAGRRVGKRRRRADAVRHPVRGGRHRLAAGAPVGVRPAPVRRRPQRGGVPLLGRAGRAASSRART